MPLDGCDIRALAKNYLDRRGFKVFPRENLPGVDWLRAFVKRHCLVYRLADNVTPSKFEVDEPLLNSFFDCLSETVEGVPPENIINFDETNLTDDPSKKKCIVRRGLRRVERKANHSKQAFSVMFAGSAAGIYLPPMVVYKASSGETYTNWESGGPKGAVYKSTMSGWFDTVTFEIWFFRILLPFAKQLNGPKVLVGDNLGSHFSVAVVESCLQNDIRFTTLVPNSTHILQPLDVAVFRSVKISWRQVLSDYRNVSRRTGSIEKVCFPALLDRVFKKLEPQHLISGFRGTGLYPLDRTIPISKLPGKQGNKDLGGTTTTFVLNESCLDLLREHCKPAIKQKRKSRGRKVEAIPGKPLAIEEVWVCSFAGCKFGKVWQSDDDNRWILCDSCNKPFHLQCSGHQYGTAKNYNSYDIESCSFDCDGCT